MNDLQQIKDYIRKHKLLAPSDKVIVGVSGGPDSVFLLYLLHQWQHEFGIHLHVAHVNHRLRKAADQDQQFVETLARKLKIPCSTAVWGRKEGQRSSLEERARLYRLQFFSQLAKRQKTSLVALAHTQDDLAETVLMRLIRGTGLQGLRAMRPSSPYQSLEIVRPLLGTRKKDIHQYLKKHKIPYCIDITNQDIKFFRNKIRHQLLPLLVKDFNPQIYESLANVAEVSSADYDFLEARATDLFRRVTKVSADGTTLRIPLTSLRRCHPAIQRLLLRKAIERLQGNTRRLTFTHMKEMEDLLAHRPDNSRVHLPQQMVAQKDKKNLRLSRTS